jgi:hypothetical protein
MLRFVQGLIVGAAISGIATWVYGNAEINVPAIAGEGYTSEFCDGQAVRLSIGGSRFDPRLAIDCPTRPCAGVAFFDADHNYIGGMVPGVPLNTDCKNGHIAGKTDANQ